MKHMYFREWYYNTLGALERSSGFLVFLEQCVPSVEVPTALVKSLYISIKKRDSFQRRSLF